MSMEAARQTDAANGATHKSLSIGRGVVRLALGILLILLLINLERAAHLAAFAIVYPYGLDYGEGIVWQQMLNMVAGRGYAPIGVFPAIVYHYPPVFHLASAGLAALSGIDQLAAGRLVSLMSTVTMLGLVAVLAACSLPRDDTRTIRMCVAILSALLLVSCYPVSKWATMMRVDMLQIALSLAGILSAILSAKRPALIVPAAIAFVLAIYTKQTAVAGPAAAFTGLILVRPRVAIMLALLCAGLGAAMLGWLEWSTAGGFLRHTFFYNINRFDSSGWQQSLLQAGLLSGFIATSAIGAGMTARALFFGSGASLRQRIASDQTQIALLILLVFFLIKTLMLTMMFKSGASYNYLIEWLCCVAIFAAHVLRPVLQFALGSTTRLPLLPAFFGIGILPIQALAVPNPAAHLDIVQHNEPTLASLVRQVRASPEPVISDDMVLLIRAGKPVMWEPAIAAELADRNLYDERSFASMIRRHRFGFFITEGVRGNPVYDSRYNPTIADAIDDAYPRKQRFGALIVHTR